MLITQSQLNYTKLIKIAPFHQDESWDFIKQCVTFNNCKKPRKLLETLKYVQTVDDVVYETLTVGNNIKLIQTLHVNVSYFKIGSSILFD